MRCPHLAKDVIYTCSSGEETVPAESSLLRKYCKDGRHNGCPNYKKWMSAAWLPSGMEYAA